MAGPARYGACGAPPDFGIASRCAYAAARKDGADMVPEETSRPWRSATYAASIGLMAASASMAQLHKTECQ